MERKSLRLIGEAFAVAFGTELIRQGRQARAGGLIKSMKVKTQAPDSVSVEGNHYWTFVDKGVRASAIKSPFAPPRIAALIEWLGRKGVAGSDKVIRGIAYAIAYTHGKKGMPTRGGRFDKSRIGFRDKAINNSRSKIDAIINKELSEEVELMLKKL
jgi:hypothetical protein